MIHSYTDLIVWQKSMDLVVAVYELTEEYPKEEVYGLTSQTRRSAVSIPSNIAEGRFRGTRKEFLQFLRVAYSSGAELETQIKIAKRLSKTCTLGYDNVDQLLVEVMKMLNVMIRKLNPQKLMKLKANEAKKGFSLVEALVAIGLLITVIGGALAVAARGLALASESRDRITAFYLAQEPIEYLRMLRDGNKLSGNGWLDGMASCNGADCYIDVVADTITICPVAGCPNISIQNAGGVFWYGYGGGTPTKFSLTTRITPEVSGDEAEIYVEVEWPGRFNTKTFELRDRIFDW